MSLAPLPESCTTLSLSSAYSTREQQLALRHRTVAPYLHLDDGLCRAFLQAGANPFDFEGVKLLFPFVRDAALLQLPRALDHLPDWLYFSFLAGHDLGTRHPDLLSDILPDPELAEVRRRLKIIQNCSEQPRGTGPALCHAFANVARAKWPEVPLGGIDAVCAEAALKSLRSGFAAATIAQHDPQLCDFFGFISPDARLQFSDILSRHLLGVPADSIGLTLSERLAHPVLRLVQHLYPGRPTECAVVQHFLREHLKECGALGENDCPASDAELMDWIAAGISYGRRLRRGRPDTVRQIFAECGQKALETGLAVVRQVVAQAGSLDPASLLPVLKRWQQEVYRAHPPHFYGQAVERVALFVDFAVWIPWGVSRSSGKRNLPVRSASPAPPP